MTPTLRRCEEKQAAADMDFPQKNAFLFLQIFILANAYFKNWKSVS